jgi:hypothetical protein
MKIISVIILLALTTFVQCGRPMENEFDENEEKFLNEEKLDSEYYYLFKEGKFNEIVSRWDNKDKFQKDTLAFVEYRKSMYYISLIETSNKADLNLFLKEFSHGSYYKVNYGYNRYEYTQELYSSTSKFMLNALLIYDFMNYYRYGITNHEAFFAAWDKHNPNAKSNDFFNLEFVLRENSVNLNNNFFDSLRQEYSNWSYIDSLEKNIHIAKSYTNVDL